MVDRKEKARRKLLGLMPRARLEEMSEMDNPWHADRKELVERCLVNWDADDVEMYMQQLIKVAE